MRVVMSESRSRKEKVCKRSAKHLAPSQSSKNLWIVIPGAAISWSFEASSIAFVTVSFRVLINTESVVEEPEVDDLLRTREEYAQFQGYL